MVTRSSKGQPTKGRSTTMQRIEEMIESLGARDEIDTKVLVVGIGIDYQSSRVQIPGTSLSLPLVVTTVEANTKHLVRAGILICMIALTTWVGTGFFDGNGITFSGVYHSTQRLATSNLTWSPVTTTEPEASSPEQEQGRSPELEIDAMQ